MPWAPRPSVWWSPSSASPGTCLCQQRAACPASRPALSGSCEKPRAAPSPLLVLGKDPRSPSWQDEVARPELGRPAAGLGRPRGPWRGGAGFPRVRRHRPGHRCQPEELQGRPEEVRGAGTALPRAGGGGQGFAEAV
uniref:Uncharacterized protein n=1 Tax=Micrurus lemniscatus lemniscatus TaxID=129467 RepID=A0A2D4IAG4_MICLE